MCARLGTAKTNPFPVLYLPSVLFRLLSTKRKRFGISPVLAGVQYLMPCKEIIIEDDETREKCKDHGISR